MKSDDVVGRVKTYEAIVKGQNVPKPGIPESFRVLIKELQALGLDIKVLDKDNEEIDLRQSFDDDDDVGLTPGVRSLMKKTSQRTAISTAIPSRTKTGKRTTSSLPATMMSLKAPITICLTASTTSSNFG